MSDLHEHIDEPYVAAATPVIELQLAKAGARLADVLNHAFAPRTAATAQNAIATGLGLQLAVSNLQPGAQLIFRGVAFTGQFSPSLSTLQAQGVRDISFGGPAVGPLQNYFSTMTLSMQNPLPGSGSTGATTFTVNMVVLSGTGEVAFTPENAATVTASLPNAYPYNKPVTTTGQMVFLPLPPPLPACFYEGCGPVTDCIEDFCTCEQDKKRKIFDCCP